MPRVILAVVGLIIWVYSIIDVLQSDRSTVRRLPKGVWVVVTIVLPVVGGILWLLVGRPGGLAPPRRGRPQGPQGPRGPVGPDDDPDFLRGL